MNLIIKKIRTLSLLLLIFIMVGTIGFYYIENLSFIDSLWYSTMTLTTVGYGVPENFSDEGKLLTIFLMLFGVGIVLYLLTNISLVILNGDYIQEYKRNKILKKMNKMENHIIICGFGRNGREAARKLKLFNKPFIIVDKKELAISDTEFKDEIVLLGDAINDNVLQKANVENAEGIISAVPSDADNLFIVITARQLNPNLKIISRASNRNSISKLKLAGADNVIMPDKIGGNHMASLLVTPDLIEFMDNITIEGSNNVNLYEINTQNINKKYFKQNISELKIKENTGCTIIGYKDDNGKYFINPDDSQIIDDNNYIIVIGKPDQIVSVKKYLVNELAS